MESKNLPHILMVAPGNSIHSFKWGRELVRRNFSVTWVSWHKFKYHSTDFSDQIQILNNGFFSNLIVVFRLFLGSYDILQVHSASRYLLLSLIFYLRCRVSILTIWGSDVLSSSPKRVFFYAQILLFKIFNAITTDSDQLCVMISQKFRYKGRVEKINFGVDTSEFQPRQSTRHSGQALRIISTRNHYSIYDIETCISAARLLKQSGVDFKLFLAGSGPLTQQIKDEVDEYNLGNEVVFLGSVANQELPSVLQRMDIYVSTSRSDAGIAASTAEAMACGLPVVISDVSENYRWVGGGEGFLFPAGSSEALFKILKLLALNEELRTKAGRLGRHLIVNRNSLHSQMNMVQTLYADLLKN